MTAVVADGGAELWAPAPYCLDVTEVTVGAYGACVQAGRCTPASDTVWISDLGPEQRALFSRSCNGSRPGRADHPVNCVTARQAAEYCAARGARLPTDGEWVYAARGGDEMRTYPWGPRHPSSRLLNGCGAECRERFADLGHRWAGLHYGDDRHPETAPVGSFPRGAGRWGHLDLAGNVWELTSDRSADAPGLVVIRGGGWAQTDPRMVQGGFRAGYPEDGRSSAVGFRCAADPAIPPAALAEADPD